jgi:hypothetical protein
MALVFIQKENAKKWLLLLNALWQDIMAHFSALSSVRTGGEAKWIDCCKSFGTMANHTYVVAKNADHHVWQKNPDVVITEVTRLYQQVADK